MEVKTERTIAYCLAAVLLVVGVICYTALAKKAPEQPLRIMFKNTGGKVLFDHKEHLSEAGYGFECADCHHTMEDPEEKPESCGECHTEDGEDGPKRSDAFHQQCKSCHEEGGGPVKCEECHAM
ncbi:MAG: cytochrome c3 family protein [Deltaproteobacteria bacterium]|nr:cytochrome c3 family protein [Deltaproteobacteria bacterium]MBW2049829.1 cytochrome c3 family protein [Deltaproteobacteria bacterium]MBW2112090.1 cytochrome c3 family protein [Deltaproteobacteria bacterium]MBW2354426.1 cytochrome c3 family protein [Deltaproteobacteria bacterium]HDZ90401.1 cytochrome C [Deltaproteobacteria bacterium]